MRGRERQDGCAVKVREGARQGDVESARAVDGRTGKPEDGNDKIPAVSIRRNHMTEDVPFTAHAWHSMRGLCRELGREGITEYTLAPASADASFRRYFRITSSLATRIVMDAPPEQEDCRPFVKVAGLHGDAGVNAPRVLARGSVARIPAAHRSRPPDLSRCHQRRKRR